MAIATIHARESARMDLDPTEEFRDAVIDRVGNHPLKMLTLDVLAREPGRYFSRAELGKEVLAIQGSEPEWPVLDSVPFSYCDRSFLPLGAVVQGEVRGRRGQVPAFTVSEDGLRALPYIGVELDWELDHAQFSTQRLLGSSTSIKEKDGAPSRRYGIYHELLRTDGELAYKDLLVSNKNTNKRERILDELVSDDILYERARYNPEERTLDITPPNWEKVHSHEAQMRPEMLALYGTVRALTGHGGVVLKGDAFLRTFEEVHPEIETSKAWRVLTLANSRKQLGCIALDVFQEDRSQHTKFSLNPRYHEPLGDLINRVEAVRTDSDYCAWAGERALEIVSDKALASKITAKARKNSSSAGGNKASAEGWFGRIDSLLGDTEISAAELHKQAETRGWKTSYRGFRNALSKIEEAGRITLEEKPGKGRMGVSRSFVRRSAVSDNTGVALP